MTWTGRGESFDPNPEPAPIEVPTHRLALYFTDGEGTLWTLDHYSATNRMDMPRRSRALALALLDYAREQVEQSEERQL